MATRLKKDFKLKNKKGRYPWTSWADGSWWTAIKGEDYTVTEVAFASAMTAWAVRHGYDREFQAEEGRVTFKLTKKKKDTK